MWLKQCETSRICAAVFTVASLVGCSVNYSCEGKDRTNNTEPNGVKLPEYAQQCSLLPLILVAQWTVPVKGNSGMLCVGLQDKSPALYNTKYRFEFCNKNEFLDSPQYPGAQNFSPRPSCSEIYPIMALKKNVCLFSGQYQISDVANISFLLYEMFGKIVALRGLVGRPDLLFIYDADEIEKFYRQEGPTPFRPSMPCLVKYKSEIRKDFFGRLAGIVAVWVIQDTLIFEELTFWCWG